MVEDKLLKTLEVLLPGARLDITPLPQYPQLELFLLNKEYPQHGLNSAAVTALMNTPLYWVFCWASGQVLAKFLRDDPSWVEGKRVLDFGCGSGVVAIAAALAGAQEVIACDIDPLAIEATRRNAQLNGVAITLLDDYCKVLGDIDLIIVADVLYDQENLPWLARFADRASKVLVADSRIKDFNFPPYVEIGRCGSCTIPDLDESAQFGDVRLYLADSSATK